MNREEQIAAIATRALSTKLTPSGHKAFVSAIDARLDGRHVEIHLTDLFEILNRHPEWVDGPSPPRLPGFATAARTIDRSQRRRRGEA